MMKDDDKFNTDAVSDVNGISNANANANHAQSVSYHTESDVGIGLQEHRRDSNVLKAQYHDTKEKVHNWFAAHRFCWGAQNFTLDSKKLAKKIREARNGFPENARRVARLHWIASYDYKKNLSKDFVTGITLGVLLIPQGLSYGLLAGLPAYYGLYACLVAPPVYGLFCSSNELSIGPFALISILIVNTVSSLVPVFVDGENGAQIQNGDYIDAVIVLSFFVSILLIGLGMLQLGLIVNFLSDPVLSGLTTGGSFLIATSQMKYFLGVTYPDAPTFFHSWKDILTTLDKVNVATLLVGLLSIALLMGIDYLNAFLSKKFKKQLNIPGPLVCLVVDILLVFLSDIDKIYSVKVLGNIPSGLPAPHAPRISKIKDMGILGQLFVPACVITIVGYSLSMATAKTLADKRKYEIKPNQELFAHGVANLAGTFFLSHASFASLSRSALAYDNRVDTPLHNFVSALLVLIVLLLLTVTLEPLPYAALSAIILYALRSLFKQVTVLPVLFKADFSDFVVWIVTFFAVLSLGIDVGLGVGVVFSFVLLLRSISYPPYAVLGQLPIQLDGHHRYFKDIKRFKEAKEVPGVLIFRFDSSLHFANRAFFRHQIRKAIHERRKREQEGVKTPMIANNAQDENKDSFDDIEQNTCKDEIDKTTVNQLKGSEHNVCMDKLPSTLKTLILEASPIARVDSSGLKTFQKVVAEVNDAGLQVLLCGAKWRLRDALDRFPITNVTRFPSLEDAVRFATSKRMSQA